MKSDETLEYFKNLPSSLFTFDIPKSHQYSHLHNFENLYKESTDEFWKDLGDITKKLLDMDSLKTPKFVFLCGTPGSGKTHIAVGLYRAMVEKIGFASGGGVLFKPFMSMVADIISGFSENIPTRDALALYTKNKWLFLDDFSSSEKVFIKDSFEYQLFRDIALNRWDSGGTLITSTNLEADALNRQFHGVFGEYVMSRLSDSFVINFPDQDLRKK